MPLLVEAGYRVLAPDMRGYGDSDKPAGTKGYDGLALAEEFRLLIRTIGFGAGRPITIAAHDMGAPPALLWAAEYPEEVSGLVYIEVPVMLQTILEKIIDYTPARYRNDKSSQAAGCHQGGSRIFGCAERCACSDR